MCLAVSSDYSFIVPSATMVIHPVRTNGMFIGVEQSYRNMEKTQDRITEFISGHSNISVERLESLMLDYFLFWLRMWEPCWTEKRR